MTTIRRMVEGGRGGRHEQVLHVSCDVDTEDYAQAHGRKPRGAGSWTFEIRRVPHAGAKRVVCFQGTYGDALKQARAAVIKLVEEVTPAYIAKQRFTALLVVCP